MKIKLTSFKEIDIGRASVHFDVLDDNSNYLSEFYLNYEVVYNRDKNQSNGYRLSKSYFSNLPDEEIYLDNIDWRYIDSEEYKALNAFDKKYNIE